MSFGTCCSVVPVISRFTLSTKSTEINDKQSPNKVNEFKHSLVLSANLHYITNPLLLFMKRGKIKKKTSHEKKELTNPVSGVASNITHSPIGQLS